MSIRSAAAGSHGVATSTFTIPATWAVGDVALLEVDASTGITWTTPTTFGAWNQIGATTTKSTLQKAIYWKYVQAGEPGSTFSMTLSNTQNSVGMTAYSGLDQTNPIHASTITSETATQTTHTTGTLTTTAACFVYESVSDKGSPSSSSWSVSTGATMNYSVIGTGTSSMSIGAADTNSGPVAAGTVGGHTFTGTLSTATAIMTTVALLPASGSTAATGAGTVTLAGAATAAAPDTGAGSFTVTGANNGPLATGTGAVTLSGAATAASAATAGGSVTLAGASGAAALGVVHHTIWEPRPSGAEFVTRITGGTAVRLKIATTYGGTPVYSGSQQTPDTDGYVRDAITSGLTAGTRYYYWYTDQPVSSSETAIGAAGSATSGRCNALPATGNFSVAFGGCQTTNNTESRAFADIESWAPDLFLHLGDFHYMDPTSTSYAVHVADYESQIAGAGSGHYVSLFRDRGAFYNPSDHDFGPSDNGPSDVADFPGATAASQAVRVVFPTGTLADTRTPKKGNYRTWVVGPVRFIHVDVRNQDRSNVTATGTSTDTMLGATQLAWLKTQLVQSEPFKVIVCDTQWMGADDNTGGVPIKGDWWPAYPVERNALIAYMAANNCGHVELWHSDAHMIGNATASKNTWGNFPVLCAAPFANTGGGRDQSTFTNFYANSGLACSQYGRVVFTYDGTTITRTFYGWDAINNVAQMTDTVSVVAVTAGGSFTLSGAATGQGVVTAAGTVTLTGAAVSRSTGQGGVTLTGAATGTASATGAATVTLAGAAATVSSAAGSLTLAGAAAGSTSDTGTGTVTIAGTGTAQTPATAAAAITLTGTGTGQPPNNGTGTLTLTGTATATAPTSPTGSFTISAASTGSTPDTGSGNLTLSGTVTAHAPDTGTGTFTVTGTAAGTPGGVTGTATVTLTGTASSHGNTAPAATITITATAAAAVSASGVGAITITGSGHATNIPTRDVTLSFTLDPDRWDYRTDPARYRFTVEADVTRTIYTATDTVYVSGVLTETSGADLTGDTFQIGLGPYALDTPPTVWRTPDDSEPLATGQQRLKLLVGASGYNPGPGNYRAWVRVTDNPETESVADDTDDSDALIRII